MNTHSQNDFFLSCFLWEKLRIPLNGKSGFKRIKEIARHENLEYVVKTIEQMIPLEKPEWKQYFYYAKKLCFKVSFFVCDPGQVDSLISWNRKIEAQLRHCKPIKEIS